MMRPHAASRIPQYMRTALRATTRHRVIMRARLPKYGVVMTTMTVLAFIACIASRLASLLASPLLFRFKSKMTLTLKLWLLAAPLSYAAEATVLWIERPIAIVAGAISLVVYAMSMGLFVWAIHWQRRSHTPAPVFASDAPDCLIREGPYRYVRHPLYLSYMLTFVATLVATQNIIVLGLLIATTLVYFRGATLEESLFTSGHFASQYEAYRARTGMFLPAPLKLARDHGAGGVGPPAHEGASAPYAPVGRYPFE